MKKTHYLFYLTFSLLCSAVYGQINMSNTTTTVNTTSFFYDDAGGSANYSNNLNLTQTIITSTANHRIKVSFSSFATINSSDSLSIYNGTTPSPSNFLVKCFGTLTPSARYSTGNSMTFRFVSDATGTAAGWVASVSSFGISSITQTSSSQSSSTTFDIYGNNTEFNTGISGIYLVHSVSGASLAVTTYSPINATQLQVSFNIPCNADLGMYELRVMQPVQGITVLPNAFNVTPYDVTLTGIDILCAYNNTGSILSSVNGGTFPYNYLYSPLSITTPTATNLAAGIYTLSVSDANSCVRTKTISLTEPPPLYSGNPNSQTICSGQSAMLTMIASGGVPGYTYNWSGPSLSNNTSPNTMASPLSSSTYNYSVQDANGCVHTGTLTVAVNNPDPVSITATPNPICQGGISTLTASGPSASYTWNHNGATTSSINESPMASTIYSVTGLSTNGCTKTETIAVTVNPNPTASATTNTPVCAGGNLAFTNNSTGANNFFWSGPAAYSSTASSPVIPGVSYAQGGTYTLNAMDATTGCSSSTTLTVIVNAPPTLTLSSNISSVCAGNTYTATATGATTYTWLPGSSTGASQTFTPSANTTYTVSGTDAAGCIGTNTIGITVNALTAINGTATANSNPVAGNVILYKYEPFLTKFDSVTIQSIAGTGAYSFTSVPAGSYIVKAIPTANTLQVTYGSSAISWQNATVITHSCISSSSQNINVVPFSAIVTGPGSLSGRITEGQGFGQRPASPYSPLAPGQPIGGIVVKGGKNPGGSMFAQTTTAANGTYTLAGLPNNAAGESYFILVDIPGLDTNNTYHKVININSPQYTGLDFVVDSVKVNPVPSTANGIKDLNSSLQTARLFPNPAHHFATLRYSLPEASSVSAALYNVLGETVGEIFTTQDQAAGTHEHQIPLNGLKAGMYFLKLKAGASQNTLPLMITE